eukprot:scaffold1231_cov187-Pinguiococcus_pyrenoidosus.AAC.5
MPKWIKLACPSKRKGGGGEIRLRKAPDKKLWRSGICAFLEKPFSSDSRSRAGSRKPEAGSRKNPAS